MRRPDISWGELACVVLACTIFGFANGIAHQERTVIESRELVVPCVQQHDPVKVRPK